MRMGVALWTRRGWRVQSQSGKFNMLNPFNMTDAVTVVFEEVQDDPRSEIEPEFAQSARVDESEMKQCPDCAESVKRAARVCRYCGYRFDRSSSEEGVLTDQPPPPPEGA